MLPMPLTSSTPAFSRAHIVLARVEVSRNLPFASLLVCAGAAAGLALGSTPARAALLSWSNAGGGSAALAANWSPAQIPAAADDLLFNLGGFYTITFNATVNDAATHLFRDGNITLSVTSPHTVAGGITIADLAADSAGVTLTTGTLQSNGPIVIGDGASSFGTLSINDDDADLITTTALGDLTVGNNGSGSLSITGGGLVDVADRFVAGANLSSSVSVTVSGYDFVNDIDSELHSSGGQDAQIGAGGDVMMSVNTGALADFAADLVIANGSASTSTLSLGGIGIVQARVRVGGDLRVGVNETTAAAGNGTLSIFDDGRVEVDGVTKIGGDPQGGTGALNITENCSLWTHGLIIGSGGSLTHTDGTIRVIGGAYTPPPGAMTLNGSGFSLTPNPTLILEDGATCTLPGALTIGSTRQGTLTITGAGSTMTAPAGAGINLGIVDGGDGTMNVSSGGHFERTSSNVLTVGDAGDASLLISGGGSVVEATNCLIAKEATSFSNVSLSMGGMLYLAGTLFVGGDGAASGGNASLTIASGAEVSAVSATVWDTGFLFLSDGAIDLGSTLTLQGDASMFDSIINASQVNLSNGDLSGFGAVNARINVISGSSSITASGGPLTLGAAVFDGFSSFGTLNVGNYLVTINDSNGAALGNVTIAGGTLIFPDGSSLASTRTLSGAGTIRGDLVNSGTITPTGLDGLTFTGAVTGVGMGISGTRITFGIGPGSVGSLSGTGSVNAEIAGILPSSTISATGPLTLGKVTSANGVNFGGQLIVGPHAVTLIDLDSALPGSPSLNGGTLTAVNGLTVASGRQLSGEGVVDANVTANGLIAPGFPSSAVGRLDIDGTCTFGAISHLAVNINGAGTPNFDRLIISGAATLGGTLSVVVGPGFTPFVGQTFTVLSAASRSGTFSAVNAMGLPSYRDVSVNYTATGAQVVFIEGTCPADIAPPGVGDGTVDVDDLIAVILAWGRCPSPPALCSADTNGDGTVDVDDLIAVILGWGACP